jgi:hypothetical protein
VIGIRTSINSQVVFGFWLLQFVKIVCHTSRLRFSKQRILVLLCLETIYYRSPPTTRYRKNRTTHGTFYFFTFKLTSCINGTSTFNGSLKLHFASSKTCFTVGETRRYLCTTRLLH